MRRTDFAQVLRTFNPATASGRPLAGPDQVLRVYVALQCFGLSREDAEDALYGSGAIRTLVSIALTRESPPEATTKLKDRWLLDGNPQILANFSAVSRQRDTLGLRLSLGASAHASITAAATSAENRSRAQTRSLVNAPLDVAENVAPRCATDARPRKEPRPSVPYDRRVEPVPEQALIVGPKGARLANGKRVGQLVEYCG